MLQNTKTLRRVGGGAAVVTVAGLLPLFAASAASAVTGSPQFTVDPLAPGAISRTTVVFTTTTAISSTNNTITIKPTTTPGPGFMFSSMPNAYTVNGVVATGATGGGAADAPVVITVSPSTVAAAGGTVTVVANATTNPTAGSTTSVTVATIADGTSLNSNTQTFNATAGTAPTVTQVNPVAVPSAGGTPVTITGSNFSPTGNIVTFQPVGTTTPVGPTVTGTSTNSSDGTTITVTSPPLMNNTSYDVTVNNGMMNTATSATSAADQLRAKDNLAFIPLVPTRALDTRSGFGGPRGQVQPGQSVTFALPSVVPAGATGVAVNVTSITPTGPGNAVVFQSGGTVPATSSVNFVPTGTDATGNFALVPLTAGQNTASLTIRVGTGTGAGASDFTADVTGYFTGTSSFSAAGAGRVLDTRPAPNRTGNLQGPLAGRVTFPVSLTNVPAGATAVALNSTAINPTQVGNLQVFPTSGAPGDIATVQYVPGLDTGSFSVVPITRDTSTSGNASVNIYSDSAGTVNVAIDVAGYLNPTGNTFTPVNKPGRVLDTRQSGGPITPGAPRSANVEGRSFGTTAVTTGQATSALVSVASVLPKGVGNLRGFPTGSPVPNAATINYFPNQSRENFAIVAVRNGSLDLAADGVPSDATVDVLGIF